MDDLNGPKLVKWIGDAPHRMLLDEAGVLHFEDKASYCDSPGSGSEILPLSSAASPPRSQ